MSEALETREELPVIDAQIVRYQPAESLAVVREPEQVLADAQKAAAALMKVVSGKKKQVTFNGETYLESGDWQTVAKFYGVTAKVESTKFVTFGEASGFEAAAVALDCNGREVSRGEAMCLNDEENWGMRPKYEWQDVLDAQGNKIWEPNPNKPGKNRPKSKKVQVGETPTPLFQLRSMAQTRACAKALSNLFKWVVVLAGYKPTPAEEMTGQERGVQNSSVDPDFEPDLPSESDAISHQPTGAAQAPPVAQSPTTRPAASPAASQPQVGVLKFIPPNGLTTVIKAVKEIVGLPAKPASGDVPAMKAVKAKSIVTFLGVHNGCSEGYCFDTKFFSLLKESIGQECHFQISEKDVAGKHYVNIENILFIDGQPVLEGKVQ
jgi:hypothetical protein